MANEEKILTDEQRTAVQQLQRALSLLPIENPLNMSNPFKKILMVVKYNTVMNTMKLPA